MMERQKGSAEDPTMETQTKQGKKAQLQEQYNHLQREWDSIKQSKPTKTLRRSTTDPRIAAKALQLFAYSPADLMSSLQHGKSGAWKVRTNDLAVDEILRERRAAMRSGNLKGRRLFPEVDFEPVMINGGGEVITCHDWDGLAQESEVRSISSYDSDDEKEDTASNERVVCPVCCQHCTSSSSSSSSSFLCEECMHRKFAAEEVVAASVQEEIKIGGGVTGYGKRWRVAMRWLAIGIIVCALSIVSVKSFRGRGKRHEVNLVPT